MIDFAFDIKQFKSYPDHINYNVQVFLASTGSKLKGLLLIPLDTLVAIYRHERELTDISLFSSLLL